jgi:hypothetical protein
MSSWTSALRRARPIRVRDRHRQTSRHPWRCHRTIVSGEACQQPEQLVAAAQMGTLTGRAGQDGELLAKQEVVDDQVAAVAEGRTQNAKDERQVLEHRRT